MKYSVKVGFDAAPITNFDSWFMAAIELSSDLQSDLLGTLRIRLLVLLPDGEHHQCVVAVMADLNRRFLALKSNPLFIGIGQRLKFLLFLLIRRIGRATS